MRAKLAEIGSELPFRYALPFVVLIFGVGYYGFSLECPVEKACSGETPAFAILNNALRTFSLFFSMPEPGGEGIRNWWLMVARWIAPCITLFGLFRLFGSQIDKWWNDRQLRKLFEHHVIIGSGHGPSTPHNVVAINAQHLAADFHLQDNALSEETLIKAGVVKAKSVSLKLHSDSETLEGLEMIVQLMENRKNEVLIEVNLHNASLVAELNRNESFGCPSEFVEVVALNSDHISADNLLRRHPLSDDAKLRGLKRVHLAVIGWSRFSLAIIEKFCRLSPYLGLEIPRISILTDQQLEARTEIFHHFPVLLDGTFVKLDFIELPKLQDIPVDAQIIAADKTDPVSAVAIGYEDAARGAVAALALRRRCQILGHWLAPIYVLQKASNSAKQLFISTQNNDQATQIIAIDDSPNPHSGWVETLARSFHEAYQLDAKTTRGDNSAAMRPWSKLPQTYRLANRTAAARAVTKLLSTGYIAKPEQELLNGDWTAIDDRATLEKLAEVEHRGWMIDRLLDGWRYGKIRDNKRLLHPDLRPYKDLPESVKELDRAQIRQLRAVIKNLHTKNKVV